jgi:pyruvate/2-oxoglutarate dehydrogenase complex dihydrolipoamide dehydrogenase (E3) component
MPAGSHILVWPSQCTGTPGEVDMSRVEQYDALVLGSGTGGKVLAWTLARQGKRTASVERKYIGGACPNVACLPSKNVIHTAKFARLVKHHQDFGIQTGPVSIDMAGVYARKRNMVDDLVRLHVDRYHASGAELILGQGTFVGPRTLQVALNEGGERTLAADRVFLNLGSHATIPGIPGLHAARPLTHVEALDLHRLPEHLLILGGGYVGVEMAQAMRRLGSRVTLIARSPQLTHEDPDVAQAILELFEDEGIEVRLRTDVSHVDGLSGDRVNLQLRTGRGTETLEGSDVLVAVGRTPNTADIGLEKAGIEINEKGHVRVNDRLESISAPDVWAVGECAGSPYFTHVSEDDARIVLDNLNGGHSSTSDRLIPYCVFTDPPLGRIGLDETEARERRVPYRLAHLPMEAVWRAWTLSETRGFMKALIGAASDRILGFTCFGSDAGEVLGAVQTAMLARQPYTILRDAIFPHPTMNEGLKALFAGVRQPAQEETEELESVHSGRT